MEGIPCKIIGVLFSSQSAVHYASCVSVSPPGQVQYTGEGGMEGTEGDAMVRELQAVKEPVDEKLSRSQMQLFKRGGLIRQDEAGTDDEVDDDEDEDEDGGDSEDEEDGDEDEDEDEDGGENEGMLCLFCHVPVISCPALCPDLIVSDDEDDGQGVLPRGMPRGGIKVDANGRTRRRALFEGDAVPVEQGPDDEEGEGDDDDDEVEEEEAEVKDEDSDDEEGGEDDEEDDEGGWTLSFTFLICSHFSSTSNLI